jgi:hypothetical protein
MGTGRAANTSVIGTRVEIDRKTMFANVTIKDWNIQIIEGCTSTGTHNPGRFNVAISKSLGGTGAVTPMGSAVIGTAADGIIVDSTLTETNLVAGDDLVLSYEVGTALPAETIRVEADVSYVEHFVDG